MLVEGVTKGANPAFASDVREGLSRTDQKELPAKYLYDDLGSVLFEAITHLPEYGLTRADDRLLKLLAGELPRHLGRKTEVAELGSGSGKKTRRVLSALSNGHKTVYRPIDVSAAALDRCRRELAGVAEVQEIHNTYLEGLREASRHRTEGARTLLLFLGSNIGNFDRLGAEEFLRDVRACLEPGDALLLGADLVKPLATLLAAYDDPTGVTAAFNLNVLGRINRELDAEFDLRQFRHEARYRDDHHRVEMHLRSLRDQTIPIHAADFRCELREGETIWTEASHKFTLDELRGIAERTGFRPEAEWVDPVWPFAENLWIST